MRMVWGQKNQFWSYSTIMENLWQRQSSFLYAVHCLRQAGIKVSVICRGRHVSKAAFSSFRISASPFPRSRVTDRRCYRARQKSAWVDSASAIHMQMGLDPLSLSHHQMVDLIQNLPDRDALFVPMSLSSDLVFLPASMQGPIHQQNCLWRDLAVWCSKALRPSDGNWMN